MKNTAIKFLSLLALVAFLSSCGEAEKIIYDGDPFVSFTDGTMGNYFVQADNTPFEVTIGIPSPHSSDITVTLTEVLSTGASYTLPETVTIPKDSVTATIEIAGIFDALAGIKDTLEFTIESEYRAGFDTLYTMYLQQFCPFTVDDFVGAWTMTETSAYNGPYDPYTVNLAANPNGGDTLVTSDIWPYAPVKFVFDSSDPAAFLFHIPDQYMFTHDTYGDVFIVSIADAPFSSCDKTMGPFEYKVYVPGLGNFDLLAAGMVMD